MSETAPQPGRGALSLVCLDSIDDVSAEVWDGLVGHAYPFLRHAFLHALEASGAASSRSGWVPYHLTLWQQDRLVGAMPHYRKAHSYGEYVFDWAWADAWQRAGGDYYPKGLSAIPFTPAPGPRLVLDPGVDPVEARQIMAEAWSSDDVSSWHLLFAEDREIDTWRSACPQLIERHGVQFQWHDDAYGDFEGFLAALTSKRRKEIRRERRRVADQGLTLTRRVGNEITSADLAHFYRCYQMTYLERGQQGYLNLDFFGRLLATMPETLVLIQGWHASRPVAAALCFQGQDTLYGRYWGSEVEADCLHFEACYYQGIEYCLAQGLSHFDPGTQGEHKLARGFAPRRLRSLHYLADPGLRHAVARFCAEERQYLVAYHQELSASLPYKQH
ncbi:GNAT family N-acetyltransferase [Litchfieldella xinjiangensis]|uniref:GNAT family N-acetyltransferase n=1 Tax=Litchfieldella xinjiangensis TaxID=1166948 RepID=UPI000694F33E|nr:GNAT family N-acetyltransferase [Halomonas xinjiangensis]